GWGRGGGRRPATGRSPGPGCTRNCTRRVRGPAEIFSFFPGTFPRQTSHSLTRFTIREILAVDSQPLSVKGVFERALEIESLAERQTYLDQVGAQAPEVRQKV